mgnify:CR=1 FL=1
MFLNNYLNDTYLSMLCDNYEEDYINSIDEENFIKIYNLFKEYDFYFIEDIIIYCLEVFEYDIDDVRSKILKLKEKLGPGFVYEIGNNLNYLENVRDVMKENAPGKPHIAGSHLEGPYFADSQKEAKAGTGTIGEWEGKRLMVIPQVIKEGTFNLALDNDTLFIMGGDVKPIKVEFIGDTRTQEVRDGRVNNDMTMELQVQTCFGMGMMLPEAFGLFRFA